MGKTSGKLEQRRREIRNGGQRKRREIMVIECTTKRVEVNDINTE